MSSSEIFKKIPSIDKMLKHSRVFPLLQRYPQKEVVNSLRKSAEFIRQEGISPEETSASLEEKIVQRAEDDLAVLFRFPLRAVVNATGIILHTNLGRAPLSRDALLHALSISQGYCDLELDLATGTRGKRNYHVNYLLCRLSGAEASLVVNNNAAAVYLVLDTLAKDKEVVVSRGQLIEIGGSFRLPEVFAKSGAKLIEVGTTNNTYLEDFQKAITDQTGAFLYAHTSNYKIYGFSSVVEISELVPLAKKHNILTIEDLGSGAFVDVSVYGLASEPLVQEKVKSGVDIVTFSGDKLLGGCQAGIIVGRRDLLAQIEKNPLMRALRVDKVTFAILGVTLSQLLQDPELLPLYQMLSRPMGSLRTSCQRVAKRARTILGDRAVVKVEEDFCYVGGGSLPTEKLPTWTLAIKPSKESEADWHYRLRTGAYPVLARLKDGKLILDFRTVFPYEEKIILQGLKNL